MKKQFVPYKEALALKELGFDEPCFGFYVPLLDGTQELEIKLCETHGKRIILAPTFSQVFRWFREKYELYSCIERVEYINSDEKGFQWSIFEKCSNVGEELKTYEEAELECLKKLIELCKK